MNWVIPISVPCYRWEHTSYWCGEDRGLGSIYFAKVYPSYEDACDGTCELQTINAKYWLYGEGQLKEYTCLKPIQIDFQVKTQTIV